MTKEKKFLLIDDDPIILDFISDVLKSHNTILPMITKAQSGEIAIELLKQGNEYDLIISDYEMDQLNGYDIYNFLKTNNLQYEFVLFSATFEECIENHQLGEDFKFFCKLTGVNSLINYLKDLE